MVRVEPPLGVGGCGPDLRGIRDFEQNLRGVRILGFLKGFKVKIMAPQAPEIDQKTKGNSI